MKSEVFFFSVINSNFVKVCVSVNLYVCLTVCLCLINILNNILNLIKIYCKSVGLYDCSVHTSNSKRGISVCVCRKVYVHVDYFMFM